MPPLRDLQLASPSCQGTGEATKHQRTSESPIRRTATPKEFGMRTRHLDATSAGQSGASPRPRDSDAANEEAEPVALVQRGPAGGHASLLLGSQRGSPRDDCAPLLASMRKPQVVPRCRTQPLPCSGGNATESGRCQEAQDEHEQVIVLKDRRGLSARALLLLSLDTRSTLVANGDRTGRRPPHALVHRRTSIPSRVDQELCNLHGRCERRRDERRAAADRRT
eukprot:3810863-Prymnesium_polylepis.2